MSKIFLKEDILNVAPFLLDDQIILLPTDTVYGLACVASSPIGFAKLIDAKRRPLNKAFPLAVSSILDIEKYAIITPNARRVIEEYIDSPLTVILKKKDGVKDFVTSGKDTIAIRLSNDSYLKSLILKVNEPLLLTSANLSGEKPIESIKEALDIFKDQVAAYIDGDLIIDGLPTTIVDLTKDEINIIRQGSILKEDIEKFWR